MENLTELMQTLLEIQSGGRQRSPELVADDERLMDGLQKKTLTGKRLNNPLFTRSGYWSTLQPDGPSYRVFAKQMTNPPAACGLSAKSTIDKSATTKSVQDDANRRETPK
jgi:hypothetical protein